jgi:hypothetical protein
MVASREPGTFFLSQEKRKLASPVWAAIAQRWKKREYSGQENERSLTMEKLTGLEETKNLKERPAR